MKIHLFIWLLMFIDDMDIVPSESLRCLVFFRWTAEHIRPITPGNKGCTTVSLPGGTQYCISLGQISYDLYMFNTMWTEMQNKNNRRNNYSHKNSKHHVTSYLMKAADCRKVIFTVENRIFL